MPQTQQQLVKTSRIKRDFFASLASDFTRKHYGKTLQYFCNYIKEVEPDNFEALLQFFLSKEKAELENILIDYILFMKEEKKLSPHSIGSYLNPIRHFLKMNDIINVNWYKVNKFQGKKHNTTKDRPYTREEIQVLVNAGTIRDRLVVLLMSSAGLRIGALPLLKLGDLKPINKYNLYQVTAYSGTESEYITFTTPGCRKVIEEYLSLRKRYHEHLTNNSPLLRLYFDTSEPTSAAFKHPEEGISYNGLRNSVMNLLNRSGVRPMQNENRRTEIMVDHAFRKYFSSTLETEGVNPVYIELMLGHNMGLKTLYSKPTAEQLLEGNGNKVLGYVHGIDALTINEEDRLKIKIKNLTDREDEIMLMKVKHEQEMRSMRDEMEVKFQQIIGKIDTAKLG